MAYCQNCGYDSHCGTDCKRVERDWRGKLLGEIVVCQYCRCELCENKLKTPWPGPGV